MTAPLCDAITNRSDSQTILNHLERANLFLIPLDEERHWYRYHHLFADLLHSTLKQTEPNQVPKLHRRASEWYEVNGLLAEAMNHALATEDAEMVARLVAGNALAMVYHGELRTLAGWLGALSEEEVRSRPWLSISHAWALVYTGSLDAVEPRLQDAEDAVRGLEGHRDKRHIDGHIAAIRSYAVALRGELSKATDLSREAVELLPEEDLMARGFATSVLSAVLRWQGEFEAATLASEDAIAFTQAAGLNRITADAFGALPALQFVQGQLNKAYATAQGTLQLSEDYVREGGHKLAVTGFAYVRISAVMREWNDLEAAWRYAKEGIELCKQWGWVDGLVFGYEELAWTLQAVGDGKGAFEAIQKGKQAANNVSPWLGSYMAAQEARLCLMQGNLAAASRWAQESGLGIEDDLSYQSEAWYASLAIVLLSQGRLDDGICLLSRMLKVADEVGAMGSVIGILVVSAIALKEKGEIDQALVSLERALGIAGPEGYIRTFVDEGEAMGELLRKVAVRGFALEYVSKLLTALEETGKKIHFASVSPLSETLSERELEVLRLLTTRLSSPEIAQELVIAVSTVRSHIRNIYSKLGVHRRTDAVHRAKELGLLN
jgi:LuxR family maltose regulon positive regulatory protein